MSVVISGTGLFTPKDSITNEELVESYNKYVDIYNSENEKAIASGEMEALTHSNAAFIKKVSGIEKRYVLDKEGILNPQRMRPNLAERPNDQISIQAEISISACKEALDQAGRSANDVDAVICGCANLQRAYPAVAIEIQQELGIEGYAYDMNVACSSSTFALQNAANDILSGVANCILVVNPDICSGHLNFRDRDGHFIFGDACTAILLEKKGVNNSKDCFEILGTKLKTSFSNNIRNNFGFLNKPENSDADNPDKLFIQKGKSVFKEVVPMVVELISTHLEENNIEIDNVSRFWLHQANLNMNTLISKRLLGREPNINEVPVVLNEYANTSSAGSIIAFHKYKEDLVSGQLGVICSFGAGYSVGSVIVRKD